MILGFTNSRHTNIINVKYVHNVMKFLKVQGCIGESGVSNTEREQE